MSTQWKNYIVFSKYAKNSEGHLDASQLLPRIDTHPGNEAYYNAYDLEPRATFKGYQGLTRPAMNLVSFDFDSEENPELAFQDMLKFIGWVNSKDQVVFFSGKKGFHVGVPSECFGITPSLDLPHRLSDLAHALSKTYATLDTSVYNANRKFRLPRSKHPGTGLYKIQIPLVELLQGTLKLPGIQIQAKTQGKVFLADSQAKTGRAPLPHLVQALKEASKPSYDSYTEDRKVFTEFERYDDKLCIKRMLENRAEPGHKQAIALRLICDFYNQGKHYKDAQALMSEWCIRNNITDGKVHETLDQIYGGEAYSFGCNDAYKSKNCSAKCAIFKRLSTATKPNPIDAPAKTVKETKFKIPPEKVLAELLLQQFEGNLIKQGRSLFIYVEHFWREVTLGEIDQIKCKIMDACQGLATSYQVDSIYRTFLRQIPHVEGELNLFDPNPFGANFEDGTLHLIEESTSGTKTFRLDFRPHRREDFMTNLLPMNYALAQGQCPAPEFDAMLGRVFHEDPDKDEKVRAVRQMYGACLMPRWPHLFMLYGPPQTGKSTVIQIAEQLVTRANRCSVEPHEFHSFNMETMVGKLLNSETDISSQWAISDAAIKRIEDRRITRIKRKGFTDVYGFIPAIHIFGGNDIPPTAEGAHKAHDRRWTFIEFKHIQGVGNYDKEYWRWLWELETPGILKFALEGLQDLCATHGHFLNPASGKERMAEWQESRDPVSQFLNAVRDHEVNVGVDPVYFNRDDKMTRQKLYNAFKTWTATYGAYGGKREDLGSSRFYATLRKRGLVEYKSGNDWYFKGFGANPPPDTQH